MNKKWIFILSICICLFYTVNAPAMPGLNLRPPKAAAVSDKDSIAIDQRNAEALKLIESGSFNEAEAALNAALKLAISTGYTRGEAEAYKLKGILYNYKFDTYNAINYSRQALELYRRTGDSTGIANLESNLGAIYVSIGDATAIDYLIPALKAGEKLKDTVRIVSAMLNLAALYYNHMRQPDKAEQYFKDIKKYLDADFQGAEAFRVNYLAYQGEYYLLSEQYEKASQQFTELLPLEKDGLYYSETLRKVGEAQLGLGNDELAASYLKQAVEEARKAELYQEMISGLTLYGKALKKKDPDQALKALEEAYTIAEQGKYPYEFQDVNHELYELYRQLGDFKKSLEFHERYLSLKDSLFNLEANDKVRYAQLNFDIEKKENKIHLLEQESKIADLQRNRQKSLTVATFAFAGLLLVMLLSYFNRYKFIKKSNKIISAEKLRSENLLLNILPEETAQELLSKGKVEAKKFESVTVMFTDFKGFTQISETMSPEELVKSVDHYFSRFDAIMEKYELEKIKTIGDAYMCAGGLPFPIENHAQKVLLAAMEILELVEQSKISGIQGLSTFEIRIGIHTGPVVAGVVGTKKFAYDIWGDTVNVANRMESSSVPGRINISETTYARVKDQFYCKYRGEIEVKNKGKLKMYFANGLKTEKSKDLKLSEKQITPS